MNERILNVRVGQRVEDSLERAAAVMGALERGEETPPASSWASLRSLAC